MSASGSSANRPQRTKLRFDHRGDFRLSASGDSAAGATGGSGSSRMSGASARDTALRACSAIGLSSHGGTGRRSLLDRVTEIFFDGRELPDHPLDAVALDAMERGGHQLFAQIGELFEQGLGG